MKASWKTPPPLPLLSNTYLIVGGAEQGVTTLQYCKPVTISGPSHQPSDTLIYVFSCFNLVCCEGGWHGWHGCPRWGERCNISSWPPSIINNIPVFHTCTSVYTRLLFVQIGDLTWRDMWPSDWSEQTDAWHSPVSNDHSIGLSTSNSAKSSNFKHLSSKFHHWALWR